jgi:site-specific DNA recombinase
VRTTKEKRGGVIQAAFYGRVSTEDQQDPVASRSWQLRRARQVIEPHGGAIVAEFFDVGVSRSLPWKRRPEAARLLQALADPARGFSAVVIGEPQRAFYGNQFSLTFPVFTHYGVQLWVPEVGGAVDPGSEAHDIMMMLFGGMSKAERTRVQLRVKAAMFDLAQTTDRFLGGRPPYGYRLVDAGPHPNPGKAAMGQRAHRLEPDPVTGPIVARIFRLFADGMGLRAVAQLLTDEGVPSPSAHDRQRNSHRDARGWAHSAVRAILMNDAYTGRRVWAKQQKVEQLIDPDDVAAGHRTSMRWREPTEWLRPERQTHPPLVSDELHAIVKGVLAGPATAESRRRASQHPYCLRGLLFCEHCGRRMQGAFRRNRREGSGRVLYRCLLRSTRSIPAELEAHPGSFYVREDAILPKIDAWLASLITPEMLAAHQHDPATSARTSAIRAQISELDKRIANLSRAIELGGDLKTLVEQLARRTAERDGLMARLRHEGSRSNWSAAEMARALDELGGIAALLPTADAAERAKLYATLGLRLDYNHELRRVRATADKVCVPGRVRRGT